MIALYVRQLIGNMNLKCKDSRKIAIRFRMKNCIFQIFLKFDWRLYMWCIWYLGICKLIVIICKKDKKNK